MSASDNWRDSSNWRSKDASQSASPSPRFPSDRPKGSPSWRERQDNDDRPSADGGRRPFQRSAAPGSRSFDRRRALTPQKDEDAAAKAIAEGRRIYIGNLRYQAKPDDIEELLKANDFAEFENIHISIDPFTGRNPSYCFVEFKDKETADKAMTDLEGKMLLGREVKCRPCQPKGGQSGGRRNEGINRWGDWSADKDGEEQAENSRGKFDRYRQDYTGRRLYVGGLPRMTDQSTNFNEITELFEGFKLEAISKRVSAHESKRNTPGNHDYCFIDFATEEDAQRAQEQVNGRLFKGGRLRVNVSVASGRSRKWDERDQLTRSGNGGGDVARDEEA
ncbi:hypothetical protein F4778DRAFT_748145 [Xylariomycetidae sp. FL2044]|nr:hypothetical protein F4778DRAFT_748145 [Xylariomycetidae sp. FL2044]